MDAAALGADLAVPALFLNESMLQRPTAGRTIEILNRVHYSAISPEGRALRANVPVVEERLP